MPETLSIGDSVRFKVPPGTWILGRLIAGWLQPSALYVPVFFKLFLGGDRQVKVDSVFSKVQKTFYSVNFFLTSIV